MSPAVVARQHPKPRETFIVAAVPGPELESKSKDYRCVKSSALSAQSRAVVMTSDHRSDCQRHAMTRRAIQLELAFKQLAPHPEPAWRP